MFSHVLGHGDWNHLISNFTIILLIGPILEEKYGSRDLLLMIFVASLVVGLLVIFFFSTSLLGASGVSVYADFTCILYQDEIRGIPLSFILVVVLFLGKEIYAAVQDYLSENKMEYHKLLISLEEFLEDYLGIYGNAAREKEITSQ